MEKYIDVMDKTLKLSETCLEALEHMKLRLKEGYAEETISLMEDMVNGYYQIETALQGFKDELSDNQLDSAMDQLRQSIEHVVGAYERRDWGRVLEMIQFGMSPYFIQLKAELDKALHPYVLS